MHGSTRQDGSRIFHYLPELYHKEAQAQGEPLHALLTACEDFFNRIDRGILEAPAQLDPDSAQPEFLDWLASWVALPLDEEWEDDSQRTLQRHLISNAAELYRLRGTAAGLKYMLSAFHDVEADILEWTWPAGLQIGVTSTVGVNCTIMDRPNLSRCFVVVVRLGQAQRAALTQFVNLLPIGLLEQDEVSASTPVLNPKMKADAWPSRLFDKINHLIESEKPAHTRCFIAIEEPKPHRTFVHFEAMTIGVHSTIGDCAIA